MPAGITARSEGRKNRMAELRLSLLIGLLLGAVALIAGPSPLGWSTFGAGAVSMWYAGWMIVDGVFDKVMNKCLE